jgi:hypothetical protein
MLLVVDVITASARQWRPISASASRLASSVSGNAFVDHLGAGERGGASAPSTHCTRRRMASIAPASIAPRLRQALEALPDLGERLAAQPRRRGGVAPARVDRGRSGGRVRERDEMPRPMRPAP